MKLRGDGAILSLPLDKLAGYYKHLAELAKGYKKMRRSWKKICGTRKAGATK